MDETHISITIRPIYIERLVYWIIIAVLAVLLAMAHLGDDTQVQQEAPSDPPAAAAAPEPTMPDPEPVAEETCADGERNQDETDVDCGGSCGACATGDSCSKASDCASGFCTAGICTASAPKTLSGKVEFDLKNVEFEKNSATGAVKVTRVDYTITNGLEEDLERLTAQVFIKSKKVVDYCLNQQPEDARDCSVPYAAIELAGPDSGKRISESQSISGRYLIAEPGYYSPESTTEKSFNVVMYLYDSSGNLIDSKAISDTHTVTP